MIHTLTLQLSFILKLKVAQELFLILPSLFFFFFHVLSFFRSWSSSTAPC